MGELRKASGAWMVGLTRRYRARSNFGRRPAWCGLGLGTLPGAVCAEFEVS